MHEKLLKRSLLFLPAFLLALLFLHNRFEFGSDDLWYWENAVIWKNAFQTRPLFSVLFDLHHWVSDRATFHPLLGLPFLWIANSVERSMMLLGLFFLSISTFSAFQVLRKSGADEEKAVFGALAVCTFPILVSLGRVFLPEVPFCALSLTALAFLLADKWTGFALFYCFALLSRPFEGTLLLPFFFFYYLSANANSVRAASGRLLLSAFAALVVAGFAFIHRTALFWFTFYTALFPQSNEHFLSAIQMGFNNYFFIKEALTLSYGATGGLVIALSFYLTWRERSQNVRRAWFHLGLFLCLCVVFGIISTFGQPGTRLSFGRYSLTFVIFFLLSSVSIVQRFAVGAIRNLFVGSLLAMNLFVCVAGALGPWTAPYIRAASLRHAYGPFHYSWHPAGADTLANALREIIPKKSNAAVLIVGRDSEFFPYDTDITMRMVDGWPGIKFPKKFAAPYLAEIFEREIKEGKLNFSSFQVDAVIFARHELRPGNVTKPYPSASLVEALEKNRAQALGLELTKSFQWERFEHKQVIEIYKMAQPFL